VLQKPHNSELDLEVAGLTVKYRLVVLPAALVADEDTRQPVFLPIVLTLDVICAV